MPFAASVAVFAARDHLVASGGLATLAWSVPARAVLQTAFLTLLGQYVAGTAGRDYAFIGAVAFATTTGVLAKVTEAIVEDRWQGTLFRLRLGRLPHPAIALCRSPVYLAEGSFAALCAALLAGPFLVGPGLTLRVVAAAPLLLVIEASILCLGLAVAAAAVGRNADVLIANTATYLLLLTGGVVFPPGGTPWIDGLGSVLPLRHGLAATRAWLTHDAWLAPLAMELAVGAGWLAVAASILAVQARRARRHGFGEFA